MAEGGSYVTKICETWSSVPADFPPRCLLGSAPGGYQPTRWINDHANLPNTYIHLNTC
jgi:hypothetical protein